jgi:putative ABC transport system permease protein
MRIARRTSVRSLGHSALIAAMIALPIAGLAAVALVASSMQMTAGEQITTELGNTQARFQVVSPPDPLLVQSPTNEEWWGRAGPRVGAATDTGTQAAPLRTPDDLFPSGTRILPLFRTSVTATTTSGSAAFDAIEGPSWDKSLTGHFEILAGRAPRSDDEVMVTASALSHLGVPLGSSVELDSPAPTAVTVVGVLDNQLQPDKAEMVFGRTGALSGKSAADRLAQTVFYLPDTTVDWPEVRLLNAQGVTVLSRAVLSDPPPASASPYSSGSSANDWNLLIVAALAGGFAAFEVILLAGAAFAVSGRQQQRMLATIASVGATRSTLFRVLSSSGLVLGAIGGVLGIGVGVLGGSVFMALTGDGSATRYYGYHLPWLALCGVFVFAVIIGWLSSLVPARNASRVDIVSALRGSRRPPVPSLRRPLAGLALLIVGAATSLGGGILFASLQIAGQGMPGGHPLLWLPIVLLIVGPVLAQLGLALCGPLLLRLVGRALGRGGIGARLAARDAARNPARSVPALSAIMTTVFLAVFAMSMVAAAEHSARDNYQYTSAVGNVQANLGRWTDTAIVEYAHPDAVSDAIRGTFDVKDLRTIAAAPEFSADTSAATGSDDATPQALPVVPPENLCQYSPNSPKYTDRVNDASTAEGRAARSDPLCQGGGYVWADYGNPHIWVGDAADLGMILGRQPSGAATRTLLAGGAVSLYPEYLEDNEVSIAWWTDRQLGSGMGPGPEETPVRVEKLDAIVDEPQHPIPFGLFITDATADRIGLDYQDTIILGSLKTRPSTAQTDALAATLSSLPGEAPSAWIESGPPRFAAPWVWGVVGLTSLIAIAAAAVAIGLARFDGRQDDSILASLGANRLVRRAFAFWQALVITGVGAVFGAALGVLPALALSANPDIPFDPPWLQIAVTATLLPLLIACGSWLMANRTHSIVRRATIA